VRGWLLGTLATSVIAAGIGAAFAPVAARAEDIYTCVDAKGRRLTSDRPIIDCIDREQTQISPSGQVLKRIGPSLTAEERAAQDEKARLAAEEAKRQLEEKKRDRALLARYPDESVHDKERRAALATVDEVIATAKERTVDLREQRKKLDTELEFYRGGLSKAPAKLKRQIEENEQQVAAQARFIANQEEEKKRINSRYDQELARLKVLWAQRAAATSATAAASSPAKK
jgi:hypothetical protein